jgi:hypothetical protein
MGNHDGETKMTDIRSGEPSDTSLTREALYAFRYYLGNRWGLIGLIVLAAAIGLYVGGWGWLVAAGLAPIILSTLPCLAMCGLGVCMMCKGHKQSTVSREAADTATSSVPPTVDKAAGRSAGSYNCRQEPTDEAPPPQITHLQSIKEAGGLPAQIVDPDKGNR